MQVSNLDGARPAQLGLFRSQEDEKRDRLNEALDEIRKAKPGIKIDVN